jgi:hypothetical protein
MWVNHPRPLLEKEGRKKRFSLKRGKYVYLKVSKCFP